MTKHPELKTIRDYIRFAMTSFTEAGLYYGHGTDNAWDESVALVLHSLHLPHHIDISMLDANLIKEEQVKVLKFIEERVEKRIPVAYLTHVAWFAGLPFYVDERVLIPRSPIAELIENQFQPWILPEKVHTILDLCTGSACIAVACANAFPDAQVYASDISEEALAVAKTNVLRHAVEDQVHLYASDLFANIPQKKFDVIVSNPPYVNDEEMSLLPPEYLHEPMLGLQAGQEGLDIVLRILQHAGKYLRPEGILVVEVGNSEAALIERFPQVAFNWLTFQRGDGAVFLLTAEQLHEHREVFESPLINQT